MFCIDMTLWNRIAYPDKKVVLGIVSNTSAVVIVAGLCSVVVTWPVTKIVELFAS